MFGFTPGTYDANYFNQGYTPPNPSYYGDISSYQPQPSVPGVDFGSYDGPGVYSASGPQVNPAGGILSNRQIAPGLADRVPSSEETDIYGGLLGPAAPGFYNKSRKLGFQAEGLLNRILPGIRSMPGEQAAMARYGKDPGNQGSAMKGAGNLDHERFTYDRQGNATPKGQAPKTAKSATAAAQLAASGFKSPAYQAWAFPRYSQTWAFTPPTPSPQPVKRKPQK